MLGLVWALETLWSNPSFHRWAKWGPEMLNFLTEWQNSLELGLCIQMPSRTKQIIPIGTVSQVWGKQQFVWTEPCQPRGTGEIRLPATASLRGSAQKLLTPVWFRSGTVLLHTVFQGPRFFSIHCSLERQAAPWEPWHRAQQPREESAHRATPG